MSTDANFAVPMSSNTAARLERLPISWVHYRLLIIHGFGWLFDAMDVGIVTDQTKKPPVFRDKYAEEIAAATGK